MGVASRKFPSVRRLLTFGLCIQNYNHLTVYLTAALNMLVQNSSCSSNTDERTNYKRAAVYLRHVEESRVLQ